MLGWIVFAWFALNYAFAAQLVYLAARRAGDAPGAAVSQAMLWPREMLNSAAAPM